MSSPLIIGCCIYCGTKEGPLKDEHIVPYGWGKDSSEGDVLHKATCGECEAVTSKFEMYVLRELFGNVRRIMELRSRKSKIPKFVDQIVRDDKGNEKEIRVPIDEALDVLFMPIFSKPSAANGDFSKKDCILMEMQLINIGINRDRETYKANEADELQVKMQFKNKAFEKFLLKIGYCTAVKNFGYKAVKDSPVPKILLGMDSRYGTFLGCMDHK